MKTKKALVILLVLAVGLVWQTTGGRASVPELPEAPAEEVAAAAEEVPENARPLSLEEAIQMALENSNEVKLAELELTNAEIAKDRVNKQKGDLRAGLLPGMDIDDVLTSYPEKSALELGEARADMALVLAQEGLENAKKQVAFAAEAAYYGLLQARGDLEIKERSLERARQQYHLAKAQYDAGKVAKTDLLDAGVSLTRAEVDRDAAERALVAARIELNRLIGLELDTPLHPTTEFSFEPLDDIDLDKAISEGLEKRMDVIAARESLKVAEKDFELADRFYTPNVFTWREKEYALEKARAEYEKTKLAAEAEIRKTYLDLLGAYEAYPALVESRDSAAESLRLMRMLYEAGLVRSIDVAQVEDALKQVEVQLAGALYGYNMARAKFELATGN